MGCVTSFSVFGAFYVVGGCTSESNDKNDPTFFEFKLVHKRQLILSDVGCWFDDHSMFPGFYRTVTFRIFFGFGVLLFFRFIDSSNTLT